VNSEAQRTENTLRSFVQQGQAAQRAVDAAVKAKPTTDSIRAAYHQAESIAAAAREACERLHAAMRLVESDAHRMAAREIQAARGALASLRRTQTAALSNIDAAHASAVAATPWGANS
jgi:hypothetical protein